jgi:hypothetical protein
MLTEINTLIDTAQADANSGCGLSDVLFESRLQASFRGLLGKAPAEEKEQIEKILLDAGYDPEFEEYEAGPNECSLTGIDTYCCPCGQHE